MQPRLQLLAEKKLTGIKTIMSLADNRTRELWQSFMPRRKEINHTVNADFYSLELYPPHYFQQFNPALEYEKWAAVEVADFGTVPAGMHSLVVPAGLYAVFIHKGPASQAPKTYQYIFGEWMPHSIYETDARPHFALMGALYKNNDPHSEEEIWVPIRPK